MKIAIIRLSALGDIIQSMSVLEFIKKKIPNSRIDWYVEEKFKETLSDCVFLDRVYSVNIRQKKTNLISQLLSFRRNNKYDIAIDLQGLIKSAIVTRVLSAELRVGFDRNSIRESLATIFYNKTAHIPYHENVISRYIKLINFALNLNITKSDVTNKRPIFNIPKSRTSSQISKKNVLLVVGASFESKIYPIEKLAVIANNCDYLFTAIWHSNKEKDSSLKLASLTKNVIVSKKLNMLDLKKIIYNSDIVVGGDTGPTHLAWALNIPSITLFGPTPCERNFFKTKKNVCISSNSSVNPYKIDKDDFSIREIDPFEILKSIKTLINK